MAAENYDVTVVVVVVTVVVIVIITNVEVECESSVAQLPCPGTMGSGCVDFYSDENEVYQTTGSIQELYDWTK